MRLLLVEEILIVRSCKVIFCTGLAAERSAVCNLLEIVQTAGNALVAVGVECVEVDRSTTLDTGVHLRTVNDLVAVSIYDAGSSSGVGVDEVAVSVDLIIGTLCIAVTKRGLEDRESRHALAVTLQLCLAFLIGYNNIYRVQMPNITPHVCRHTYCSNMARAGMNPKTLQYLMGHSDISVTMNTYTHLGLDDAKDEMIRLQELEDARKEVEKTTEKPKAVTQSMFRAV